MVHIPSMKNLLLHCAAAFVFIFATACDKQGASSGASDAGKKIKIGFLVKQPEEPWFQTEWKFAQKAEHENGFNFIKLGPTDGEKVLRALNILPPKGEKVFVFCTPDVRRGPAITAKAQQADMKFMTV